MAEQKSYRFAGFTLDLWRGCLRRADQEIELRPKSFEVLRYLVENAGRLVARDELMQAIWPKSVVTDESLSRCVSDVRLALGDDDQRIIKTVLRRGYMFVGPVSEFATARAANEHIAPAESAPPHVSTQPRPWRMPVSRRLLVFGAFALALIATAGGTWVSYAGKNGTLASVRATPLSIVVLPFINLSGDPREDYLADILTGELTTYLSRIPETFVIASRTAFTYKGKPVDVKQIGKDLGVRYALEGSVQPTESQVRVTIQLIDTENGTDLWADTFDTDRTDTLAMQDAIVTRLARLLQIQMTAVEVTRLERKQSSNSVAEELAMRCAAISLVTEVARKGAEQTVSLCEQALQIDERNVRALSLLAEFYAVRATTAVTDNWRTDMARAEELVERALATSPNNEMLHNVKARVLMAKGHLEEATVEADRAITANPVDVAAWITVCSVNLRMYRPKAAIAAAERVMRLSPRDPKIGTFYFFIGWGHFMLGELETAIEWYRRAAASDPDFPGPRWMLAAALALSGNEAEAHEQIAQYLSLPLTRNRTISQLRAALLPPANPAYAAFRERAYEGLRKAGLPEE